MPPEDVVDRLLSALTTGDDHALMSLLAPDVRMVSDTGDATGGVSRGRMACSRRCLALKTWFQDAAFVTVDVNGGPGLALRSVASVDVAVLAVAVGDSGLVDRVWLTAAPEKLIFWNAQHRGGD